MKKQGEIELAEVTKRFGEVVAIDGITLKIPAGTYCCLLGPSGCGKTTILRMDCRHETPPRGYPHDGKSVLACPPVRAGTGYDVPELRAVPHLNCVEMLPLALRCAGFLRTTRRRKAREMLRRVHMDQFAERMPASASGGQQQRIALARSLVTDHMSFLLDEPLSASMSSFRVQMRAT